MWLEKPEVHWKALDVLAHQIVGMTFENDDLTIEKVWKTVKRSYVYKDLSYEEFLEVLKFLESIRLIRITEDGRIKRTRKGMFYYYENLSMIPDEKSYEVLDIVTGNRIGILHEEFVAKHGNPGTIFILRGMPWKIEKVERDRIYVSLEKDFESAIPSWEGELIPVPFEVAQLATEIKGKLIDELEDLKEQKLYFVPRKDTIFVEQYKDWIILHSPFGSKVNDTLARILSYYISINYGIVVGVKTDPYRILLKVSAITKHSIPKILEDVSEEDVENLLVESIKYTDLFLWKFSHVAKRFGVIRKNADYSKSTLRRIAESLIDTPVFKETVKELLIDKFDLEKTKEILDMIKKRKIKILVLDREDISPLAKLSLTTIVSDVMLTKEKWREIINLVKERLEETRLGFICLNCYNTFLSKVKDAKNECQICGSNYLGVFKDRDYDKIVKLVDKLKKNRRLSKEDIKILDYLYKTADLYKNYDKKFLTIFAGKGISVQTAIHILNKNLEGEELIKEIIEHEKRFFKIKRYI